MQNCSSYKITGHTASPASLAASSRAMLSQKTDRLALRHRYSRKIHWNPLFVYDGVDLPSFAYRRIQSALATSRCRRLMTSKRHNLSARSASESDLFS